jgi:hypothetical protein
MGLEGGRTLRVELTGLEVDEDKVRSIALKDGDKQARPIRPGGNRTPGYQAADRREQPAYLLLLLQDLCWSIKLNPVA